MDQWCEEKEKVVWGKQIHEGLSLKQGNSMSTTMLYLLGHGRWKGLKLTSQKVFFFL